MPRVLAKQPGRGRMAELHVGVAFRRVVGETLAASCERLELRGSTLTITTSNPALAHQLRIDSGRLIERINAVWTGRPLREIRVRTGRLPARTD